LTANRTGRRVLQVQEATAVGNVLIQGTAAGLVAENFANCGRSSPRPFRLWSTSRRARR
jgi:sugar (pentulose or hexulose) kinase